MKEYRKNELKSYVIGNILVIILFSGLWDLTYIRSRDDINEIINSISVLFGSALVSSVLYIYVYILDSMIPSMFKDAVIYCFYGRPGDSVFEKILKPGVDVRFTPEEAKEKYKEFYTEINQIKDEKKKKRMQNSKWYGIYQSVESNEMVSLSQRDFLLNRDMCIITIAVLILYIAFSMVSGFITVKKSVIVWMVIEIVATKIAALSKAKRFVLNVITKDIHSEKN